METDMHPLMHSQKQDKHPVKAAMYRARMAKLRQEFITDSVVVKIPAMASFQLRYTLEAYYGGRWRMIRALIWEGIYLGWHSFNTTWKLWITDRMGWTKLYDLPGSTKKMPMRMRHGRKCSGSPNCNNMNCIEDSLPRWFKWLTRWDKI